MFEMAFLPDKKFRYLAEVKLRKGGSKLHDFHIIVQPKRD
jgi:hypothetical protein